MYRPDGPEELRPVGEVEFVQGLAAAGASGIYGPARPAAAIIGAANLDLGAGVAPVIDALQAASPNRFRGVRAHCGYDPHPEIESRAAPERMGQANFRDGARILAQKGLLLELTAYFHQAEEMAALAQALPDLPLVFNHIGGLLRVGPYANRDEEVLEQWRRGIDAVAACPNIYMKLGGVGQPRYGFDWHEWPRPIGSEALAADLSPLLNYCIEQFGPQRCMFESNFPVDKVSYSYPVLFNAFKRLSAGYSPGERAALFHDTAAKLYGIA